MSTTNEKIHQLSSLAMRQLEDVSPVLAYATLLKIRRLTSPGPAPTITAEDESCDD